MIRFATKIALFTAPFFVAYTANLLFWNYKAGNLSRTGYYYQNPRPMGEAGREIGEDPFRWTTHFPKKLKGHQIEIMVFGDSFSRIPYSYANNLAKHIHPRILQNKAIPVTNNQLHELESMIESSFFDSVHVETVLLELYELPLVHRTLQERMARKWEDLVIQKPILNDSFIIPRPMFFSEATVLGPLINLTDALGFGHPFTETKKIELTNHYLFHPEREIDHVICHRNNFDRHPKANNPELLGQYHARMEAIGAELEKYGTKFILMIVPGKASLYREVAVHPEEIPMPAVFDFLPAQNPVHYTVVPTLRVLRAQLGNIPELYYYDDTHWAPNGSRVISDYLIDSVLYRSTSHDSLATAH